MRRSSFCHVVRRSLQCPRSPIPRSRRRPPKSAGGAFCTPGSGVVGREGFRRRGHVRLTDRLPSTMMLVGALVQVASFRNVGAPQVREIELSSAASVQLVSDAPRTLMAAANQGEDDVIFYIPDGEQISLPAGAAGQIPLDGSAAIWVRLA